jgi:hypothetical protein
MRTSDEEDEEDIAETMNELNAQTPRKSTWAPVPTAKAETAPRALPNRNIIIVEDSSDEEGAPLDIETIRRHRARQLPWVKTSDYVESKKPIPAIVFEDYSSPFSPLLGVTGGDQRIQAIAQKSTTLLAAVSGKHAPLEKGSLIKKLVASLVSNEKLVAVTQSTGQETWWVVEVESQEQRDKVLGVKSMWSTEKKVMVVFRKVLKRPQKRRFSVIDMPSNVEQHHITAVITEKYGATDITWDRMNLKDTSKWVIGLSIEDRAKRATWVNREALTINDEAMKVSETIMLLKAPHCVVCHGEDHVRHRCEWRSIFGNVNLTWGAPLKAPFRGVKPKVPTSDKPPAPTLPAAGSSSVSAVASSSGRSKPA